MLDSLHCLVIDQNGHSRNVLRQTLREIARRVKLDHSQTLKHASDHLEYRQKPEILFLSSEFGSDEISEFVESLNENYPDSPPKRIMLLKGEQRKGDYIADQLICGFDGFLCAPYSTEKLLQLVNQVQQQEVSQEDKEARQKLATGVLLASMTKGIDHLATKKSNDELPNGFVNNHLKDLAKRLQEITESTAEQIGDTLVHIFSSVSPPSTNVRKAKSNKRAAATKLHDGERIFRVMQELDIEQERLISMLNVDEDEINYVLQGDKKITPRIAVELARVLGRSKDYWLGGQ